MELDPNLSTSLSGLPDKIVAGSGFHSFKLNVSNKGKNDYKRVDLGVFTAQIDEDTWGFDTDHLTLQFQDPESGKWVDISLDAFDEGAGYLGFTDVRAKESFSINLRLNVDKSAPAGLGYAISIGAYVNDKGNCVIADDEAYYEFTIVAAGSDPGKPNEAKPQGGKKPLPAKPVGDKEIKPEGSLAQTGSSSMMPVIGMAGGIAIVAGAGVVFALKRRRSGEAAA
ncbi:LPXTG cell wall anchor domain-containing protein [Streptomyces paludis]|uniref:LPXTG cell wall anchor domain-containing protein n=1 Tax=Streptomyces paludis TaxID=2282738 RepID=A0A345I1H3_9ACTN|nr:LPXTG cell wall anchor domain-containing protein [Streptomyces paludis]